MKLALLIATLTAFSGTAYASGLSKAMGHTFTGPKRAAPTLHGATLASPLSYNSGTAYHMMKGFELTRAAVKTGGRNADRSVIKVLRKPTPTHKESIPVFERNVYGMNLPDGAYLQSKIVSWNIKNVSEGSMLVIHLSDVKDIRVAQIIARSMGHGSIVRSTGRETSSEFHDIEVITYLHAGDFPQIIRNFNNLLAKLENNTMESVLTRKGL